MKHAVLIISSSPETRSHLARIFSNHGWAVRQCRRKAEARQCLNSSQTSVVVTDSKLPDGTWRDVLELSQAAGAPVIVTSPHADEALWADVLFHGAFDVLAQPLEEGEVVRIGTSAARSRPAGFATRAAAAS